MIPQIGCELSDIPMPLFSFLMIFLGGTHSYKSMSSLKENSPACLCGLTLKVSYLVSQDALGPWPQCY